MTAGLGHSLLDQSKASVVEGGVELGSQRSTNYIGSALTIIAISAAEFWSEI